MTVRLLLVDDEPLVRTGIGLILKAEPDMEVVGSTGDGAAAVALAAELHPDVVLMDVRMPGMDGVEATRRIVASACGDVLVLSTYSEDEAVRSALSAGACGFLLKDALPDELVAAVHAIAAGEAWLDPAIAKSLLAEFTGRPAPALPPNSALLRLTPREREVLVLAAHGLTNQQIAAHLVVTEATVKTHVGRVLTKLGLHDRAQAVAAAYRGRLVTADEPLPPRRGKPA
jgi:DNA-binding NarL/FixJ family response regulator